MKEKISWRPEKMSPGKACRRRKTLTVLHMLKPESNLVKYVNFNSIFEIDSNIWALIAKLLLFNFLH